MISAVYMVLMNLSFCLGVSVDYLSVLFLSINFVDLFLSPRQRLLEGNQNCT